jgi:serine/threonine protein kinase
MPTTSDFLTALGESGIMTAEELAALAKSVPPERQSQDARLLAADLVSRQVLTKFQAANLCQGNGRLLLLGNYVVLDKLGQGSTGEVYQARHRPTKRIVALKVLPAAFTADPAAVERLERDVKAAAQLAHPNLVKVFKTSEAPGHRSIVMEYVDGRDLGALVKAQGPLKLETALDYMVQAAQGVEFAHAKGIVDLGVKPSHLLLNRGGVVRVLDLGVTSLWRHKTGDATSEDSPRPFHAARVPPHGDHWPANGRREKDCGLMVGCIPGVIRRHYDWLDRMVIAKRSIEKRLAVSHGRDSSRRTVFTRFFTRGRKIAS